jgi:hypothetical protein
MTDDLVVVSCSNTVSTDDNEELLRLRQHLRGIMISAPVRWVDHTNSGIIISHDNKTLEKAGGNANWDKICRSVNPLTRGLNVIEFIVDKSDQTRAMVVGVHPNPNCKAGLCEPGFHVSSVGISFNSSFSKTDRHNRSMQQSDTSWMVGNNIRVEVDFITDRTQIFCNGELKVSAVETHKPSKMPNCYFTFMLYAPHMKVQILTSRTQ